jgi:hypothetical protein
VVEEIRVKVEVLGMLKLLYRALEEKEKEASTQQEISILRTNINS